LRRPSRFAWLHALFVLCSLCATDSAAQEPVRRLEVGGSASVVDLPQEHNAAVGAEVDVNVSPILSFHGRVSQSHPGLFGATLIGGGIRTTFIRRERWLFYGAAVPGWYRSAAPADYSLTKPHFVLDLAAGLGVRVAQRTKVRVELERQIHAQRARETFLGPNTPPAVLEGTVGSNWRVNVSASYAFGTVVRPVETSADAAGQWVTGIGSGMAISPGSTPLATLGGFISRRLSRFVDFDGDVTASIGSDLPAGFYEGGRMVQAFGGIKAGLRDRRLGVFFKFRGGFTSWSSTRTGSTPFARQSVPAFDLGGVIEYGVGQATVLRVDAGETVSFFSRSNVGRYENHFRPLGGSFAYILPFRIGVGFRF